MVPIPQRREGRIGIDMPFKSEAQRKYLFAKHPEVAKKFAKDTPKGKKLPEHAKKKGAKKG
jgi:hypothetical protein